MAVIGCKLYQRIGQSVASAPLSEASNKNNQKKYNNSKTSKHIVIIISISAIVIFIYIVLNSLRIKEKKVFLSHRFIINIIIGINDKTVLRFITIGYWKGCGLYRPHPFLY